MYIKNNNGHCTEPWGTPNYMVTSFESLPLMDTSCFLINMT